MPDIEQVILPDNVTYDIRDTSKLATSLKGAANGVAELDINGIVPESQLPTLEKSTSGSLVSFNDGGDNIPLGSLIANITAVQSGSGTPSPSNVRAISGWSGCNLGVSENNIWSEQWEVGSIDATTGQDIVYAYEIRSKGYINVNPNTAYFFKKPTGSNSVVYFYNSKHEYLSYSTVPPDTAFSTPQNAYYIRFRLGNNYGTTYNNDVSINYPSTVTTYQKFGKLINIPFGQTVYGGTLDVLTGLLTVTHRLVDLGTLNWNYDSTYQRFISDNIADLKTSLARTLSGICSIYICIDDGRPIGSVPDKSFYFAANENAMSVYIHDSTYTDAQTFRTAMNGVQLVYPLATPVTYQLTPAQVRTLLGLNNIFADTGDISLSYFTQNANAINDIAESNTRTALNTDVPKTDLTDIFVTGTKNNTGSIIPVNKFFYLNGELVVCKQAIEVNADVTLNTNYVKVTAGVLNDLSNVLQTVTPTSSDKLLVVQSQGQGLVPYGSKLDSANPTGTGSLSLNKASGSSVGSNAVVVGNNGTASGTASFASGYGTTASGDFSTATGHTTTASGGYAFANGRGAVASGQFSQALGDYTIANHRTQHVFGAFNLADTSSQASDERGNYVEIVGKGTSNANRSNARTLDWSGNETIAGTLTQSSDAKLKDIINEALPDVSSIKAVKFKWKENANRDSSEHIGYIAQEVEKVLPYLVKEDAEGNKVLDYIAFLVAKVDSLEKRLAELEG